MSTFWKVLVVLALIVAGCSMWWQFRTRSWMINEMIPRTTFHDPANPPDPYKPPDPPPPF